jgi:hypothetical protein
VIRRIALARLKRTAILANCLLLACSSATSRKEAMRAYTLYPPWPDPYDRALHLLMFEEFFPDLWRLAGSAPIGVINGGEAQTYQGFVAEVVLKNEHIDRSCQSSSFRRIILWRTLPERSGVESIATWEPMAAPGHAAFPLGHDSTCALRRQSAQAYLRAVVDTMHFPVSYRAQSGTVATHDTGLQLGTPCAEPASGMWRWGNGNTCVHRGFTVVMTAGMKRRGDSTLTQFPALKTVQFKGQLPGIRLEIDCLTQTHLRLFCS